MFMDDLPIIAKGQWIYDKSKVRNVKIVQSNILYGTGDYEDEPEVRDDREINCFYVWYESLIESDRYNACGGGFLSLEQAIKSVEKVTKQKIEWIIYN